MAGIILCMIDGQRESMRRAIIEAGIDFFGVVTSPSQVRSLECNALDGVLLVDHDHPQLHEFGRLESDRGDVSRVAAACLVLYPVYDLAALPTAVLPNFRGFITDGDIANELKVAMRAVTEGGMYVSSTIVARVGAITGRKRQPISAQMCQPLTGREYDILRALAIGHSTTLMSEEFGISVATVRSHVLHILRKVGAESRAQAVAAAYRHGLLL